MTELAHPPRTDKPVAVGGLRPSAHEAGLRPAEAGLKGAERRAAPGLELAEYGVDPPPELLAEFTAGGEAGWRADSDKTAAERTWDAFAREYLLREPASDLLIRRTP